MLYRGDILFVVLDLSSHGNFKISGGEAFLKTRFRVEFITSFGVVWL